MCDMKDMVNDEMPDDTEEWSLQEMLNEDQREEDYWWLAE
jgi:hypothetical protein